MRDVLYEHVLGLTIWAVVLAVLLVTTIAGYASWELFGIYAVGGLFAALFAN